ncbi:MAG: hypothetical protein M1355_01270 [Patescibacteria group bacterium]|nr:hypothetical protein [Patescibacteria group bacterium]
MKNFEEIEKEIRKKEEKKIRKKDKISGKSVFLLKKLIERKKKKRS